MQYDYLIVGAGLFGSIMARQLTDAGYKCLVVEKRNHIGGNCYSEVIEGIHVSKYGGHIFHTNSDKIWDYVNRFAKFRYYYHIVRVNYKEKIYSFPLNMMTLYQLWGVKTPEEAEKKLKEVRQNIPKPSNLEEWCLANVGEEIYNTFIKGYNIKFWKKDPKELPASLIKRLPIRMTYGNGYFTDKHQGFPENGFTVMFERMLDGIETRLETDFFSNKEHLESLASHVVFTGKIDQYYNYKYGKLDYHTLRFVNKTYDGNYQGSATINYTDENVPYNRVIEHKHFQPHKKNDKSVVTFEYTDTWGPDKTPYYPINNKVNNGIYKKYKALGANNNKIIFGGRLAEYKYYDMDQVVGSALKKAKDEIKRRSNG